MKRHLMNPATGAVDTEENWRADFDALIHDGEPNLWDRRFSNEDGNPLEGAELEAALKCYDPILDSELIKVIPDGEGGWKEAD